MNQIQVRHHYIPIFYLTQWVGADGKLCQMSRPHERIACKRKHPAAMGYHDNLYALDVVEEALSQWLEGNFFRQTDQQGNDALQLLLSGTTNLPQNLRSGWSRFIMSLLSRTPERIAAIRLMYAEEYPKIEQRLLQAYDEAHANDVVLPTPEQKAAEIAHTNEVAIGRLIQSVCDLENVGTHLNNMNWRIFVLENGQRSLLTSDRPVHLSNGLQHDDAFLTIPISPTKLFVAANAGGDIMDRLRRSTGADTTSVNNQIVIGQAVRYVFGTDDFQRNVVDRHLGSRS